MDYAHDVTAEDECWSRSGFIATLMCGKPAARAFAEKRKLFDALFSALYPFQREDAMHIVSDIQLSPFVSALFSLTVLKAVVATQDAAFVAFVLSSAEVFQPGEPHILFRDRTGAWFYELLAASCAETTRADVSLVLVRQACAALTPCRREQRPHKERQVAVAATTASIATLTAFFDDVIRIACDRSEAHVLTRFLTIVNLARELHVWGGALYRPCIFNPDLATALCVPNSPVFDPEFASQATQLKRACLAAVLATDRAALPRKCEAWLPGFDDHPMAIAAWMEDAHMLMELARCGVDVNLPYHPVHGPLLIYCAQRASDALLCQLFTIHNLDFNATDPAGDGLVQTLLTRRHVRGTNLCGVVQALLHVAGTQLDLDPELWTGTRHGQCAALFDREMQRRRSSPRTPAMKRPRDEDEAENVEIALEEDEEYSYVGED